jgi:dTDP-3-amino-3,4,6-trideoxy-alpha-D-glucose transaminase
MQIPLIDLKAQYLSIKPEIDQAMQEVIENTAFIGGKALSDFEKSFAEFCGANHCVGVASGTAALHLALCALDVGPGDEVITVSHTFIATAEVVKTVGAKVKFVDIDPYTYCMDPAAMEAAITENTKVIIPVHIYGYVCDMDPIHEIAKKHGIYVLEDAAQSHGARYKGNRVGSLAEMGTFSFYPGKNLGAYGDGGGMTFAKKELAEKADMLANHGRWEKYKHLVEGYNARLDALQAAVLNVKLKHLDGWSENRRQAAKIYDGLLADVGEVTIPPVGSDTVEPVYHLYVIQVPNRDAVFEELRSRGVMSQCHYPIPLHLQPAYEHLGMKRGTLPVCEALADKCVSLPMFPEITEEQCKYAIKTLKDILAGK